MKKGLFLLALFLFLPPLKAEIRSGKGGASFLRVPLGARAIALGETFSTVTDDAQVLFWNPAGLAPSRTPALSLSHSSFFDETLLDSVAVTYPTLWGGVGAGTRWLTGPDLPRLRNGEALGRFSAWERTGELALAFGKRNFSLGVLGRHYQMRIDERTVKTLMGDVGALKRWKKDRYRLTAVAQNMGTSFGFGPTEELKGPPPRLWRVGFGARLGDAGYFSAEHQKPQKLQGQTHAGLEYWLGSAMALRTGYLWRPTRERNAADALESWRFGAGFRVGGVDVDYAYSPAFALGESHHISLGIRFLGLTELEESGRLTLEARTAFFSPNGDGRADSAFLFLGTEGVENISKWIVDIRSAQGIRLRRFSGRGAAPGLIRWDGTDEQGRLAAAAEYMVQGRVWGHKYQALSAPVSVTMDLTPPQLDVRCSTPVFSPDGDAVDDAVVFELLARDRNPLTHWTVLLVPKDAPSSTVFTASGTFKEDKAAFSWDGRVNTNRLVPNGAYNALFFAEDTAGNASMLVTVPFQANVEAASVLNQFAGTLKTEPVPGGYKILLNSADLFKDAESAQVSETSEPLRNQLISVAKALPGHKIVINGRVGSMEAPAQRHQLSSAQAWALYSVLVKSGVPATRLEVHGLGGEPDEPNRLELLLLE
ncbi:MAG: PorV/PorQ family protein [Elusimicrobia bacterium]|nr:PorV/PorQ family protein [Elusimicrobiota bacterium]